MDLRRCLRIVRSRVKACLRKRQSIPVSGCICENEYKVFARSRTVPSSGCICENDNGVLQEAEYPCVRMYLR